MIHHSLPALAARANRSTTTTASTTTTYIGSSDVPIRTGAVGFVVFTHMLHAFIFIALIWLDWLVYKGKQPRAFFNDWTQSVVAGCQLVFALDILGRK